METFWSLLAFLFKAKFAVLLYTSLGASGISKAGGSKVGLAVLPFALNHVRANERVPFLRVYRRRRIPLLGGIGSSSAVCLCPPPQYLCPPPQSACVLLRRLCVLPRSLHVCSSATYVPSSTVCLCAPLLSLVLTSVTPSSPRTSCSSISCNK